MSEHVAYLGGVLLGSVASAAILFTTGPETTVHADLIRQANEVCLSNIGLDKIELGGKLKLTRIYCLNGAEFPMEIMSESEIMNREEAKRLLKHTALIEAYANGPNGGDQTGVLLEEIPLLDDDEAMKAIATLQARGYSPDDVCKAMEHQPVPTTTGAKP